jgi:hypothetical protein
MNNSFTSENPTKSEQDQKQSLELLARLGFMPSLATMPAKSPLFAVNK